jgi:ankyrin repeat protein
MTSCNTIRYPSLYPNKKKTMQNEMSKPTFRKEPYLHIVPNIDKIINLLRDKLYGETIKFFPELSSHLTDDDYDGSEIIHLSYKEIAYFVFENYRYTHSINKTPIKISDLINDKLLSYCFHKNNNELLSILISNTNGDDLFVVRRNNYLINSIFTKGDNALFTQILTNMKLTDLTINNMVSYTISNKNYDCLKLLLTHGYTIDNKYIEYMVSIFYFHPLEILLSYGYNDSIQLAIDNCNFENHINKSCEDQCIQTLNLFEQYNINISHKLNDILLFACNFELMLVMKYCINTNPDCDINVALKSACFYDNLECIKYLVSLGADINVITDIQLNEDSSIEIIKYFKEIGYNYPSTTINDILYNFLTYSNNIEDVKYLVAIGGDIEYVFKKDKELENTVHKMHLYYDERFNDDEKYKSSGSILELIISQNKFEILNFLASDYFHLLKEELNRLFIISSANGNIEIMTYLLELGAQYDSFDNKAFIMACYFGHLECVKYLLQMGTNVNEIKENLFLITCHGSGKSNGLSSNSTYNDIVKDTNIFRNDKYQCDIRHLEIFKILIEYNISIPDINIFGMHSKYIIDVDVMLYFISNGFDVNSDIEQLKTYTVLLDRFEYPSSSLEVCIYYNYIHVVKILLEHGANVNVNNNNTIKLATSEGYDDIKKLLLEYGAIDICL